MGLFDFLKKSKSPESNSGFGKSDNSISQPAKSDTGSISAEAKAEVEVKLNDGSVLSDNFGFGKRYVTTEDQIQLFNLAGSSSNEMAERIEAVQKMTDNDLLYKIATHYIEHYDSEELGQEALRRITSKDLLLEFALTSYAAAGVELIVELIDDKDMLRQIANSGATRDVRQEAEDKLATLMEKSGEELTYQTTLAEIALDCDGDDEKRIVAIRKLTDQTILASITKNYERNRIYEAVIERINDQAIITDIAKNSEYCYCRILAAEKIADQTLAQEVYLDIAENCDEYRFRAASQLIDKALAQRLFIDIAKSDNDEWSRMFAAEQLTDKKLAKKVYIDLLKKNKGSMFGDKVEYLLNELQKE